MKIIAWAAGTFLGVGYIIFLVGNWVLLSGFDKLPFELCMAVAGITLVAYLVLFQTLPLVVRINKESNQILNNWKLSVGSTSGGLMYWKRELKAQQPVWVYYAQTKFEKATKINYYSNIAECTINVLLIT